MYPRYHRHATRRKSDRDYLKKNFRTTKGAWDLYVPFFERSVQLLNDNGILAFITPNKYLSAPYAEELRGFLDANGNLISVTDVSRIKIFPSASVCPVITIYRKGELDTGIVSPILPAKDTAEFDVHFFIRHNLPKDVLRLLSNNIWGHILSPRVELLSKVVSDAVPLDQLGVVQATSTAAEADQYGSYLTDACADPAFRVVNTGLIDPYDLKWGRRRMIHDRRRFEEPYIPRGVVSESRRRLYERPKIIYAKLARRPEAVLDYEGQYAALNVNCFHSPRHDVSLQLILGFSNSTIFWFLYQQFFGALKMGPSFQFQAPQLRLIPFRIPSNPIKNEIERRVAEIREIGRPTPELFRAIDALFYSAYSLTKDEIAELERDTCVR